MFQKHKTCGNKSVEGQLIRVKVDSPNWNTPKPGVELTVNVSFSLSVFPEIGRTLVIEYCSKTDVICE